MIRVGDYGGYMIVETDKPTDIHYFTSFFAVFEFKVDLVVDVMDAVAAEVAAIEYRKNSAAGKPHSNKRIRSHLIVDTRGRGTCTL